MPNFENIRRYAEINHTMAEGGGVDQYLSDYADTNRKIGAMEQKEIDTKNYAVLAVLIIPLWEGVKWGARYIKNKVIEHKEKKAMLYAQAEEIKSAILQSNEINKNNNSSETEESTLIQQKSEE